MTPRQIYLERTERFAAWMEKKREDAGMRQDELAAICNIHPSYYSRIVNLKSNRKKYGDSHKQVNAPRDPQVLVPALKALAEKLGEDCVTEGLRIWGHPPDDSSVDGYKPGDRALLIGRLVLRLQDMPMEKAQLVYQLVDSM